MIRDPSDGSVKADPNKAHNDLILDRLKGIPMQQGTWRDKFDPTNPNVPQANDNPTCQESLQVASGLPFSSTKPEQYSTSRKITLAIEELQENGGLG